MRGNKSEFDHAVGADLDYGFEWELEDNEVIVESIWSVPDVVAKSREQISENVTSSFLSIQLENTVAVVTNDIKTNMGREDGRSLILSCKKRFVQK